MVIVKGLIRGEEVQRALLMYFSSPASRAYPSSIASTPIVPHSLKIQATFQFDRLSCPKGR
jgi:hypothetical protein